MSLPPGTVEGGGVETIYGYPIVHLFGMRFYKTNDGVTHPVTDDMLADVQRTPATVKTIYGYPVQYDENGLPYYVDSDDRYHTIGGDTYRDIVTSISADVPVDSADIGATTTADRKSAAGFGKFAVDAGTYIQLVSLPLAGYAGPVGIVLGIAGFVVSTTGALVLMAASIFEKQVLPEAVPRPLDEELIREMGYILRGIISQNMNTLSPGYENAYTGYYHVWNEYKERFGSDPLMPALPRPGLLNEDVPEIMNGSTSPPSGSKVEKKDITDMAGQLVPFGAGPPGIPNVGGPLALAQAVLHAPIVGGAFGAFVYTIIGDLYRRGRSFLMTYLWNLLTGEEEEEEKIGIDEVEKFEFRINKLKILSVRLHEVVEVCRALYVESPSGWVPNGDNAKAEDQKETAKRVAAAVVRIQSRIDDLKGLGALYVKASRNHREDDSVLNQLRDAQDMVANAAADENRMCFTSEMQTKMETLLPEFEAVAATFTDFPVSNVRKGAVLGEDRRYGSSSAFRDYGGRGPPAITVDESPEVSELGASATCAWLGTLGTFTKDIVNDPVGRSITLFKNATCELFTSMKTSPEETVTSVRNFVKQVYKTFTSQSPKGVAVGDDASADADDFDAGSILSGIGFDFSKGFDVNLKSVFGLMMFGQMFRGFKGLALLGLKGFPWLTLGLIGGLNNYVETFIKLSVLRGILSPRFSLYKLFERCYDVSLNVPLRMISNKIKRGLSLEENLMVHIHRAMSTFDIASHVGQKVPDYWCIKGFRFTVTCRTPKRGDDVEEPDEGFRVILVNGHPRIQQMLQSALPETQNVKKDRWWVLDNDDFYQAANPVQLSRVIVDEKRDFTQHHGVAIASHAPLYFKYNPAWTVEQLPLGGTSPITGKKISGNGEGLNLFVGTNTKANEAEVHIEGWFKIMPAPFFGQLLSEPALDKYLMSKVPATVSTSRTNTFESMFQPSRPKILEGGKLKVASALGLGCATKSYKIRGKKKKVGQKRSRSSNPMYKMVKKAEKSIGSMLGLSKRKSHSKHTKHSKHSKHHSKKHNSKKGYSKAAKKVCRKKGKKGHRKGVCHRIGGKIIRMITVPLKGGGTRKQAQQVFADGHTEFVKNPKKK